MIKLKDILIKENIEILDDTDLTLERGKEYVLQANSPKYKRGLIVRLLEDGGYDVKYWYDSPDNIKPIEVIVDGESITKDGKIVKLGFHPQLKKEDNKRVPRKKGQHRGSSSHSDLYTDENPKGTIKGLKFATVDDAQKSVNKIKSSGKSHAHKIQAAVAMEQRAKEMGKTTAAGVYRSFINTMKKKTKAKNEKFDSKAQQRYMFKMKPKVAKKLASKMTKQDYEELPDKIQETLQYNQIPASMMKDFLPIGAMTYTTPEEKKKALKLYKDLKDTINKFWKDHKINRKIK